MWGFDYTLHSDGVSVINICENRWYSAKQIWWYSWFLYLELLKISKKMHEYRTISIFQGPFFWLLRIALFERLYPYHHGAPSEMSKKNVHPFPGSCFS